MSQTKHSIRVEFDNLISSRDLLVMTRLLVQHQALSHSKEWRRLFLTEIPSWEMYTPSFNQNRRFNNYLISVTIELYSGLSLRLL